MSEPARKIEAARIVVVMPNWLGDAVMATPFLRALRALYPAARIAAVARPLVAAVCEGLVDGMRVCGKGEEGAVAQWMRGQTFDLGILLPNSFRSAWMLWRGRVKRRLGYARGGRGALLTDRLAALQRTADQRASEERRAAAIGALGGGIVQVGSAFQPVPAIEYYLALAWYLSGDARKNPAVLAGAHRPAPLETAGVVLHADSRAERRMELRVSGDEASAAERALGQLGAPEGYAVIVPGANFGASKCWMPERFAAVAEQLVDPVDGGGKFGVPVILAGSPTETAICEAIVAGVREELRGHVHVLGRVNAGKGVAIGALKEIVRRARLMLCNDTGPRHIAAAFAVPTVTLFGPTDPVWAETFFDNERIVRVDVPCGPCQLKVCPIDHRCMKLITVEMVMAAVQELWGGK